MVSKGSKPGGPLIALMWSELISTSLLVDLLSRERVQWSIRLIIVLANGFALLNTFLANVVNPNNHHAPAAMEVNAHRLTPIYKTCPPTHSNGVK